jgi:osmotically-inducible protein OsmY
MNIPNQPILWLAGIAAAASLSACDQTGNQTAGQKLDQTVAEAKQTASEVRADASAMVKDAKDTASLTATTVADSARDLAITAKANAELARDSQLSALRIKVDTQDGRVVLTGTAPTAAAREHATKLVGVLEGVKSVDNRLEIKAAKG